ncbi:MAG TPA: hypothetical protein VNT56_10910 [Acidimicrobiales bacterium]|nr:hypothetical protein [Acidimicrobiales bacterium]
MKGGTPAPRRPEPGEGQLPLLEVAEPIWRLDRRTREIGRRGIALARAALERAEGPAQRVAGEHTRHRPRAA